MLFKKTNLVLLSVAATLFFLIYIGCSDSTSPDEVPELTTATVTNITYTTAECGGEVSSDGGAEVIARGVCWSTMEHPTVDDDTTNNGTDIGSFTSSITGLTENTTYYVRAYATNSVGTAYGDERSFTTLAIGAPILTTATVTNITYTTAEGGGTVTSNGGASVTARGVCWSTTEPPTVADDTTHDGTGTGSFTSLITGLTPNTTYYIRAYATNEVGTGYGTQISFTTEALEMPTVSTAEVTNITYTSAQSGGEVISDGGDPVTARGVCWSTAELPTIHDDTTNDGTGTGSFVSSMTGLTPGSDYYVRAYAINTVDTGYGSQIMFSTPALPLPTVTTASISGITETSADCGGTVVDDGGQAVTARGVVWSSSGTPTIDDNDGFTDDGGGTGSFTSSITGLTLDTEYYVRAYATTINGTGYGEIKYFKTDDGTGFGTVTDYDGNTYQTVKIGGQWWMGEELRVTHYRNGEAIANVIDNAAWDVLTTGAYCSFNNDDNYIADYGVLYNWYAVNDERELAPEGWHIPSDAEWKVLESYLGMDAGELDNTSWRGTDEGGKLKETGTTHWNSPNLGATNETGFTARAGGKRWHDGSFSSLMDDSNYWTSTSALSSNGWFRSMNYNRETINRGNVNRQVGFSVRCVRD
jgi:uncharacterized protein (TIGR02145 family)